MKTLKIIIFLSALIPFTIHAEGEKGPTLEPKRSIIQKLLNKWEQFNPIIETESYLPEDKNQIKAMGGTANQQFNDILTLGAGGRYVTKPDGAKTYLGLANLRLNLKKAGNVRICHEYLLKGEEIGQYPPRTTLNWSIPLIHRLTLSLGEEHRWSDKFTGDLASAELQRAIGNNATIYTRYAIQRYSKEYKAHQGTLGARDTFNIVGNLKLSIQAEYIKELENSEWDCKALTFSLGQWNSNLSNILITTNSWLRRREYNHMVNISALLPLKFDFYLGERGGITYNDRFAESCGEDKDDLFLDNCAGIAYIPRYTQKFRIVGNVRQMAFETPFGKSNKLIRALKLNLHPISSIKTSLKYAIDQNNKSLTSLWVKCLNRYFEFGIGGRALYSEETRTTNYGLSIEGGIISSPILSIVCGYKGGYNIIGVEDLDLVDGFYHNKGIYVKTRFGDNTVEELFGE